jgi:hypothetical protein
LQHSLPISKLPLEATSAQYLFISSIIVSWELHEMGFYGQGAMHKPKITMHNAKRWLE